MLIFGHDYETTGVNPNKCGVVQAALCFANLHDDGSFEVQQMDVQLLNPGELIPAGASGIHGIYDHHVADKPHWESYLAEQFEVVNTSGIKAVLGYNSIGFDNKIAARAGLAEFPQIDVFVATKRMKNAGLLEKANLSAAYEGLTGRKAVGAHDAMVDICMTLELVKPCMEFAKVGSLAEFIEWLSKPVGSKSAVMPFGKHKGVKLCNLPKSYVRWALENMTLDADTKLGLEMVL